MLHSKLAVAKVHTLTRTRQVDLLYEEINPNCLLVCLTERFIGESRADRALPDSTIPQNDHFELARDDVSVVVHVSTKQRASI